MSDVEKIAIVGAGLSGLATAVLLRELGAQPHVYEARARVGGRIHSVYDNGQYLADLGPTWVWPPFQPVIGRWLEKLNIETMLQYNQGDGILDNGPGQPPQMVPFPAQHGQVRLVGGPQALVDGCLSRIDPRRVHISAPVQSIQVEDDAVRLATGDGADGDRADQETFHRIIMAVPPRIAAQKITWRPALPETVQQSLNALRTWMAPHAKAVIVFDAPFWRAAGLSGRMASQAGPLMEVHDHCGLEGTPAALFGFLGVPSAHRATMRPDELRAAIRVQLARCFGDAAPIPKAIHIEDWSQQDATTTASDLVGSMAHPESGNAVLREAHYDGRVRFAGAEVAQHGAGLIEGALAAAEHAVHEGTTEAMARS